MAKQADPPRRDFGPTIAQAISRQIADEIKTQKALNEHVQTQSTPARS